MEFSYQNEYSLLCSTSPQKTVEFKVFDDLPLCDYQLNKKRKKTENVTNTFVYEVEGEIASLCEVASSFLTHTKT